MPQIHWQVLLGSLGAALVLAPIWVIFLRTHRLATPAPRERDVHSTPIPRLGGLLIAAIFWVAIALILAMKPDLLHFTEQRFLGIDRSLAGVLLGSMILVVVGAVDDIWGMRPWPKLLWQVVAATMLPLFGVQIHVLTHPFGGAQLVLTPALDALLLVVWIVLVINALNFLDGLDGLATGVSSISLTILALLSLTPFVNQPALALLLVIALGASLGFLSVNWHPAKIFLGDSGSHLLGFLLAVAAIMSGGKLATAALVLGFPILDAVWAILRRLWAGRSPFVADREHLHHRLLALGLSQPKVVLILMTISTIFGMIALTSQTTGKVHAFVLLVILMVICLAALSLLEKYVFKKENNA